MNTTTARSGRLSQLSTEELIDQYKLAISSYRGRCTNTSPRQKRINTIVDMISERADANDGLALRFFEES